MSAHQSLLLDFRATIFLNSMKSMEPSPSASASDIMSTASSSVIALPSCFITFFSSDFVTEPSPSTCQTDDRPSQT